MGKKYLKGVQFIFRKIKNIRSRKWIVPVSPEVKEHFDQYQLKNSIFRIRILGILWVCSKSLFILLFSGTRELVPYKETTDFLSIRVIFGFVLYNILIGYFSKKNKSSAPLWIICYLYIFFYCVFTFVDMVSKNMISHAPSYFFPLIFFAILLPDFKPKIFMPFSFILYFFTSLLLVYYRQVVGSYLDDRVFIFSMFCIVLVTKIVLYNSKVRDSENIFNLQELNKQLICANEKLEALSVTDELTKLNNRRSFLEYINMVWKQCNRLHLQINILMIDIDYFKKYNDSLGHLEGDKALIAIAQCMKNQVKRETDFIARFGGEEFVCLLPFIEKKDALFFAEALVQSVENMNIPHPMSEHSKYVTISAGIANITPDDNNTYTQLLDEADKALYIAKQTGRNKVVTI